MTTPSLVHLPSAEPSTNVVAHLEWLLEEARTGRVHSIMTIKVHRDQTTQTTWATGPNLLPHLVMSALVMAQRDWEDRMLEERSRT